jgi:gas vesicle protein
MRGAQGLNGFLMAQTLGHNRQDSVDKGERVDMDNPKQEHESEGSNAGGFLAGLVVGGLAGAGTALLLAPESGKRTRADIHQKGIVLRDQAVESVENTMAEARIKARQMTAPVRKQAKELQRRGQEILEEQRDRVSTSGDQVSPE